MGFQVMLSPACCVCIRRSCNIESRCMQALLNQTGRRSSACTASQLSRSRSCRARWAALQLLCSSVRGSITDP